MDAPPQRGDQNRLTKSPVGKEIDEARRLANTSTINRLVSKLKADPAADLAQALKQQAVAYPQLRRRLEQAAQEKATAQGSGSGSGSDGDGDGDGDSGPEHRTGKVRPSNVQLHPFLIEGSVEIIHALDQRIIALLGLTDPQNALELATHVNEAIENAEVLWRLHGTVVLGLGASVVVKIGASLDPDEVENLRYINAHVPDVPAPSFLGCLKAGRKTYHFMSRAAGVTLESVWADLSVEHKTSIKAQLNSIFRTLRKEHDGGRPKFGGFTSAICKDTRRHQRLSEPAIQTETQFNDFLCRKPGRTPRPWITMLRSGMRNDHRLVMTHGDLHPRNIMVRWESGDEDGANLDRGEEKRIRITALIDWEMSGWYPEYWEFVKALSTINMREKLSDWFEYLPTDVIGTWPVELAIDSLLDRWLA
ncbi:kinase-like domain-containing protein [Thermothelomyces heterothallicus CBS 202.75]|uniref:kinase-like domain-containing protein n=1 Tax=Thermothelomyces heterothallicus CBS 202.75 TaxID=1149848 RepID=UPI0037428CCC